MFFGGSNNGIDNHKLDIVKKNFHAMYLGQQLPITSLNQMHTKA